MSNEEKELKSTETGNQVSEKKRDWNKDGLHWTIVFGVCLILCFVSFAVSFNKDVSREEYEELQEKYEAAVEENEVFTETIDDYKAAVNDASAKLEKSERQIEELKTTNEILDQETNVLPITLNDGKNWATDILWVSPNTLINYTEDTNFVSKAILVFKEGEEWKAFDINSREYVETMDVHNGLEINGRKATIQSLVVLTQEDVKSLLEGSSSNKVGGIAE